MRSSPSSRALPFTAALPSALAAVALAACGGSPATSDAGVVAAEIVGGEYGEAFAEASCPELTCSNGRQHGCACVPEPRQDLERTFCDDIAAEGSPRTPDRDFCVEPGGEGAPDLDCFRTPREAGESTNVTVYGVVDVFANGGDSGGITIEIYREGADGNLGELVGASVVSDSASTCSELELELDNGEPTGEDRQLGFYAYPNVPTETPLIVVTRGDAEFWKPLYTYNIYIYAEDVTETASASCAQLGDGDTGFYLYRTRTLSVPDYRTIPLTAGIPSGIPAAHGAIAGEVHDCGDRRVSQATVSARPSGESFVYFTDDADNPLPDVSRVSGTGELGLYAGLDVPEGPIDVSALARVGDEIISLGFYRARIFPGSVTSVTLRGLRPNQAQ